MLLFKSKNFGRLPDYFGLISTIYFYTNFFKPFGIDFKI